MVGRLRPRWLRSVDRLQEPVSSPPPVDHSPFLRTLEHEYNETVGHAARYRDEHALLVAGATIPLPQRRPDQMTEPSELAEQLVTDPHEWAKAFKDTWSVGCSVSQLAEWFEASQATITAVTMLRRAAPGRLANRYVTAEQQIELDRIDKRDLDL
jgi:hypothetical protein